MRFVFMHARIASVFGILTAVTASSLGEPALGGSASDAAMLRAIYTEALTHGRGYENLKALVSNHPGRLSGSKTLEDAVDWTREAMTAIKPDRVYLQDVMVPHWERGEPESVMFLSPSGATPLSACALGGSAPTPPDGVLAPVVEVHSVNELNRLGRDQVAGKIVFFNGPMDPTVIRPNDAYGKASSQRTHGAEPAAKLGAIGVLVRSLTHQLDDVPHGGVTMFADGVSPIPAAAISTLAANRLSEAVAEAARNGTTVRAGMKIHSRLLPDAPSHNVIAEIRGSPFPGQIIVLGAHIDSWDITPGAHDDGAGVVQVIEALRIFRALGIQPRHTIRAVGYVNEENGNRGGRAYARIAAESEERHLVAIESDAGGFQPHRFQLTGGGAARPARWLPLLKPYGIDAIDDGDGGVDVSPLQRSGVVVGELLNDSQRYFDVHHTKDDTLDKVNPRELQLGAAALAAFAWLVDTQGL